MYLGAPGGLLISISMVGSGEMAVRTYALVRSYSGIFRVNWGVHAYGALVQG